MERILRWVREKLGLDISGPVASPAHSPAAQHTAAQEVPAHTSNIKSFGEKKNPPSDTQFAATVAYYYRFEAPSHLRKESINTNDAVLLWEVSKAITRQIISSTGA